MLFNNELVKVHSQLWVQILVIVGLPFLGWAGTYTIWLSIASGFDPLIKNVLLFGAGVFCVVLVLKGLPLLRFLRHSLTLHAEGIEITRGKVSRFFSWEKIGSIKTSDTFNILRVYDQAGNLIYAVDYYAESFGRFSEQLNAISSGKS